MRISSPAFEDEGDIPARFTCAGEDISPPLLFEDVPPEAVSLVLVMDDPDAPDGHLGSLGGVRHRAAGGGP